jgi:UDP-N-acetylmuramoyl-L-alanyl-D-glutamate--2,6-diaminopimelate ligase
MNMPAKHLISHPTLADLLRGFADAPAIEINEISSDSRSLESGHLFIAVGGERSHGLDYLADAVAAGVSAIAWDSSTADAPDDAVGVPMIGVPDLARHVGEIANRFYDSPSASVKVTGVTGTNGKTTVAWLMAQCRELLQQHCGYVGTLGAGVGEIQSASGMTTPDVIELHKCLADFRDAVASHAAIEVSSHALDQGRVDGVQFDTVLFTNLSRDHLDYHGDMQSYADAKAKLFVDYPVRHRIINIDTDFGEELAGRCGPDTVAVSTCCDRVARKGRHVCARTVVAGPEGSHVAFQSSWGDGELRIPLPGEFNVANGLIVLAALLVDGVSIADACRVLESVTAPPGRMENVPAPAGAPTVYIDFAHTPEALNVALSALRPHCANELWCVFGCGGDRDPGKRPAMGQIAESQADRLVITTDNPRGEAPDQIIDQIVQGLSEPNDAIVIEDRAVAIAWAIENAAPGDVVLVAGKGHEDYQIIGSEQIDFSDYGVALAVLDNKAEGQT